MKLYAKVMSDRAMKGQGGNKYINFDLYHGSGKNPIPFASICYRLEGDDLILEVDDYEVKRKPFLPVIQLQPKATRAKPEQCECPSVDCPRHPVEYPLDGVPTTKAKKEKGEQHQYLACIWCGKSPTQGKYAKYCSEKCSTRALGYSR